MLAAKPAECTPRGRASAGGGAAQGSDVDLDHLHERIGGAAGARRIRIGHELRELGRNDLPEQSVTVLEPATGFGLAAAFEERVPVAVDFRLIVAMHDE